MKLYYKFKTYYVIISTIKRDMKKRNITLTPQQKMRAKKNTFAATLTSFKTEGITFSPKQISELKSRTQFSK